MLKWSFRGDWLASMVLANVTPKSRPAPQGLEFHLMSLHLGVNHVVTSSLQLSTMLIRSLLVHIYFRSRARYLFLFFQRIC